MNDETTPTEAYVCARVETPTYAEKLFAAPTASTVKIFP